MRHYAYILYIILAAAMVACSSESTSEKVEEINASNDPMRFTVTDESMTASSRASMPLTNGFMVSCYKKYNEAEQQTVMPQYEVLYHTSGTAWDGTTKAYWTYDDVPGQYLRYWDYSNFPYRFNAIEPCPTDKSGFVLTDKQLHIPATYSYQTCHNGMVTPANDVAEPYMVAQVQRDTDGKDLDIIANKNINEGSTTRSRDVWLPFHHINTKVRFGIYHTTAWLTANKTYIKDLTINVTSNNLVTSATSYKATGTGSWRIGNAGFQGQVSSSSPAETQIFRFDGGIEVEGNDLRDKQTRQTAYRLQCPDGIMQIPQTGVQMTVSFDLLNEDGSLYQRFTNVPIRLELEDRPGEYQYTFDWKEGMIQTYYLVIGEIGDHLEITFTATLTPWEDVTGSLSTDLEQ